MQIPDTGSLQAGQVLARGVMRHLTQSLGFSCLDEFVPTRGLRVDVAALSPKGEIWVVECKSCRADFMGDAKWPGYLPWCDRFFFAVDAEFPADILPEDQGLILADGYSAEIIRDAALDKVAPARRRAMTLELARCAMRRTHFVRDPGVRV